MGNENTSDGQTNDNDNIEFPPPGNKEDKSKKAWYVRLQKLINKKLSTCKGKTELADLFNGITLKFEALGVGETNSYTNVPMSIDGSTIKFQLNFYQQSTIQLQLQVKGENGEKFMEWAQRESYASFNDNSQGYYNITDLKYQKIFGTDEKNTKFPQDLVGNDITMCDLFAFIAVLQKNKASGTAESGTEEKKKMRLSKPFLLFAGISGTGKSRFVREQADKGLDNFCLIPVRPDWHEPSELLGWVSSIQNPPKYISTRMLRFIVKAWEEIFLYAGGGPEMLDDVQLELIRPFWLCLDEMNLAPVEQYFSDYLSILETRKWSEYTETGSEYTETEVNQVVTKYKYECDPILEFDFDSNSNSNNEWVNPLLQELLTFDDESEMEKDCLYQYFKSKGGIPLPFNLIVVGTVNMDETTHKFSRKVIDRALTFDFVKFFPNELEKYFQLDKSSPIPLTYPTCSDVKDKQEYNYTHSIEFLTDINRVLKNTHYELGYRALNELLISHKLTLDYYQSYNEAEQNKYLLSVWDDFMMNKILPRIEGDTDKLFYNEGKTNEGRTILHGLQQVLLRTTGMTERIDLYRKNVDKNGKIDFRSIEKLENMIKQLESTGFTSFWG